MNSALKKNLCVIKTVQAMRMVNGGSNWAQNSGGSCAGSPIKPEENPAASKKGSDPMNHMSIVAPQSKYSAALNRECEHVRMTEKAFPKRDEVDKETGEFLTRFYGEQEKYFKQVTKINNAAMKRIKKLRKDWLKFCEKHF